MPCGCTQSPAPNTRGRTGTGRRVQRKLGCQIEIRFNPKQPFAAQPGLLCSGGRLTAVRRRIHSVAQTSAGVRTSTGALRQLSSAPERATFDYLIGNEVRPSAIERRFASILARKRQREHHGPRSSVLGEAGLGQMGDGRTGRTSLLIRFEFSPATSWPSFRDCIWRKVVTRACLMKCLGRQCGYLHRFGTRFRDPVEVLRPTHSSIASPAYACSVASPAAAYACNDSPIAKSLPKGDAA